MITEIRWFIRQADDAAKAGKLETCYQLLEDAMAHVELARELDAVAYDKATRTDK